MKVSLRLFPHQDAKEEFKLQILGSKLVGTSALVTSRNRNALPIYITAIYPYTEKLTEVLASCHFRFRGVSFIRVLFFCRGVKYMLTVFVPYISFHYVFFFFPTSARYILTIILILVSKIKSARVVMNIQPL